MYVWNPKVISNLRTICVILIYRSFSITERKCIVDRDAFERFLEMLHFGKLYRRLWHLIRA